ncbi:MAG: hypothetical protein IPK59_01125 [Rhodospirillaceae bacterium]|nr:hypothetical protein [Rhodospirillaceae bacterium]
MNIINSYEDTLQEAKSGHRLVASAWSFVSFVVIGSLCVSLLSYIS